MDPADLWTTGDLARVQLLMSLWKRSIDEPSAPEVIAITAFGDVFYRGKVGIAFLNTSDVANRSSLHCETYAEFAAEKESSRFASEYLAPELVKKMVVRYGRLRDGQCYSVSDFFGSRTDPDNFRPTCLGEHLLVSGVLGVVRERVSDSEEMDWGTVESERRRFAQVLREVYPNTGLGVGPRDPDKLWSFGS